MVYFYDMFLSITGTRRDQNFQRIIPLNSFGSIQLKESSNNELEEPLHYHHSSHHSHTLLDNAVATTTTIRNCSIGENNNTTGSDGLHSRCRYAEFDDGVLRIQLIKVSDGK